MQSFDLISNIGGIVCLFIGMSFVSLFQIIEILIEVSIVLFKRFNFHQPKVGANFSIQLQRETALNQSENFSQNEFQNKLDTAICILNDKIKKLETKINYQIDKNLATIYSNNNQINAAITDISKEISQIKSKIF